MKILIVEGIATSGKSSLIEKISSQLNKTELRIYGESETHIPIMDKTDDLHVAFFRKLIEDAIKSQAELVIFDRFHLTQAFRAKVGIDEYREIEVLLLRHNTLVTYLQVEESAIAERVKRASEHREESWGEYIKTKGRTTGEVAEYYIEQQRKQLQLLEQSKLEKQIFDTTNHDYHDVAKQIIKRLVL